MTSVNRGSFPLDFKGVRDNVSKEGCFEEMEYELLLEAWIRIGHMKTEGKGVCENKDIKLAVSVA